jgi:hypothetical protein
LLHWVVYECSISVLRGPVVLTRNLWWKLWEVSGPASPGLRSKGQSFNHPNKFFHRSLATSIGQSFQFSQQKSIAPPPPRFLSFTMTEILESPFEVILCEGYAGTSQISAQSRIFLNRPTKLSDNIPEAMQKANEQTKVTGGKLGEWLATGKDPLHL